jgi:hypothetical protein
MLMLEGPPTTIESMMVAPHESVRVIVYVSSGRFVATAAVPPVGDQLYVYGCVPPLAFTVAVPLLPTMQETGVLDKLAVIGNGSVTVTTSDVRQPFRSVILTE